MMAYFAQVQAQQQAKGAILIEFVMILPFFLLLLFGYISIANVGLNDVLLQNFAMRAARNCAAFLPPHNGGQMATCVTNTLTQFGNAFCSDPINATTTTPTLSPNSSTTAVTVNEVLVKLNCHVNFLGGFWVTNLFGASSPSNGQSAMPYIVYP